MTDRRFSEDEVAAIFERASTAPPAESRARQGSEGMTLAQLQEIGHEVGIAPEVIARAATVIDQRGTETSRTLFGMPIGVGRVVELQQKVSDEQWEQLVVDLRETFDARGVMRSEGSFRQWTNGNLQVLLEPSPTGHRLRLRTVKGNTRIALAMTAAFIGVAVAMFLSVALRRGTVDGGLIFRMGALIAAGASVAVFRAAQLPAWARTRRRQMAEIVERLIGRLND